MEFTTAAQQSGEHHLLAGELSMVVSRLDQTVTLSPTRSKMAATGASIGSREPITLPFRSRKSLAQPL